MDENKRPFSDETMRLVLDEAIADSKKDPLHVLAALLGATNEGPGEELNLQGRWAGDWRLIRVIGTGGMGVTYEARDVSNKRAAVKVVGQIRAGSLVRFDAECKALEHLEHSGIVRYLGRGRLDAGNAFMVMDYVVGCDLGQVVADLHENRQTKTIALLLNQAEKHSDGTTYVFARMVSELAQTLAFVHEEGIVHRDVKPANVMVKDDLSVILIDFGLSKDAFRNADITRTEAILGTLNFMAPEQAKSAATADRRADIYSLGVVLAFCVGGPELRDAVRERHYPWRVPAFLALAEAVGVPVEIQSIIYRAIQFEAKDRYRSALEFSQDLERYLVGELPKARVPGPWDRMSKHPRFRLCAAVLMTAAIAVVLTLALQREPYLLTVDTLNDAGALFVDGVEYVAPVIDLEVEPGRHEISYEASFAHPIRRTIIVDRHNTRINLRTLGSDSLPKRTEVETSSLGMLNIDTGSRADKILINGGPPERDGRWHVLSPGWHTIEAIGQAPGENGLMREIRETSEVLVRENELSSVLLLPLDLRQENGPYRVTLGDIEQRQRPGPTLDLDDGLVFLMNAFSDTAEQDDGHRLNRTCITPIVTNRELVVSLRQDFPVPMKRVAVYWRQNRVGASASIETEYRFGNGPWKVWEDEEQHGGEIQSQAGDISEVGVSFFEMRSTLKVTQRPQGFSSAEMFFGYFDRHPIYIRRPAFALVAEPAENAN